MAVCFRSGSGLPADHFDTTEQDVPIQAVPNYCTCPKVISVNTRAGQAAASPREAGTTLENNTIITK